MPGIMLTAFMKPCLIIIIALSDRCYCYLQLKEMKLWLGMVLWLVQGHKIKKLEPSWVFPVLNSTFPEKLAMAILNCRITPWVYVAFKNLLLLVLFSPWHRDSYLYNTIVIIVQPHIFFCPGQTWTIMDYIYEKPAAWKHELQITITIVV